ncbi:MAG: D-Ala-D-Ala carboxypeptidase family metallohydrolase [Devosia sp.]
MRSIALALFCALALSGCWFGGVDRNLYKGYGTSFGTYVASSSVNAFCLTPRLRLLILKFESYFGGKIVMSSGYRDPSHNASVGGVDNSFHMKCMAADIFIPGVDKRKLIAFAMREPLVGGLGCYPGRSFIHVDVRARPNGWRKPVTFSGC